MGRGGSGELTYVFRGETITTGSLVPDVAAGTYRLTLMDLNGCTRDTNIIIGQPDSLFLDLGPDRLVSLGQSVTVPITSNFVTYSQIISDPPIPDSILRSGLLPFRIANTTRVTVTATNPQGCPASDEVVIAIDASLGVYVPTAFKPE